MVGSRLQRDLRILLPLVCMAQHSRTLCLLRFLPNEHHATLQQLQQRLVAEELPFPQSSSIVFPDRGHRLRDVLRWRRANTPYNDHLNDV